HTHTHTHTQARTGRQTERQGKPVLNILISLCLFLSLYFSHNISLSEMLCHLSHPHPHTHTLTSSLLIIFLCQGESGVTRGSPSLFHASGCFFTRLFVYLFISDIGRLSV